MLYNDINRERTEARCKVVVVVSSNIHLEQFLYLD